MSKPANTNELEALVARARDWMNQHTPQPFHWLKPQQYYQTRKDRRKC